ncbi:MAG: BlaI/MecI/CopY family transcriptional regulator [Oscillospiraceae bacterium]|nr:BlaI/MecI/CopY family transcriptional regulator [Oscillospiraceae bacterium]
MKNSKISLSDVEWRLMQSLWRSDKPLSVREIMDDLAGDKDWSLHSVISFLKRMEAKNAITIHEGRPIRYSAAMDRNEAVQKETEALLGRVYGGEKLLMIQCAVNAATLSDEEREELIAILRGGR